MQLYHDFLYLGKNYENRKNIFYLTGFYGKDSDSILLLINNELYLLVNFIYLEQAQKSISSSKIKIVLYTKDKYEKLSEILRNYDVKTVGVEGKNIAYSDFVKLEKILSSQGSKLISLENIVENMVSYLPQVFIISFKDPLQALVK